MWAIFEPRSASSCRRIFQDEFARAFGAADEVVIAGVFRSSLPEAERLSGEQLVADLAAKGQRARHIPDVDAIVATCGKATMIDEDTFTSPDSEEVARLAAGAVCVGVDRALDGPAGSRALVLVRPPGHHAEADRAMLIVALSMAATPLLFAWLAKLKDFESLTLMFQKEVVDRLAASPRSKDYGRLSGRKLDEQQAGARVAVEAHKKNPGDFVLWKLSSAEEPGWPSPWGRGRPVCCCARMANRQRSSAIRRWPRRWCNRSAEFLLPSSTRLRLSFLRPVVHCRLPRSAPRTMRSIRLDQRCPSSAGVMPSGPSSGAGAVGGGLLGCPDSAS